MRLLLIEDYRPLRLSLTKGLHEAGFAVDATGDGKEGLWYALGNEYDVIILDLMLPGMDGLEILKRIRREGRRACVLILTARDTVQDRVSGLDLGADDYLVKPFAFEELTARLRALARRGAPERPTILTAGTLTIDPAARVVEVDGRPVSLTAREYALLDLFVRRAGDVLTRTEIIERVWDWAYDGTSNVVDVYVRYLRTKLAAHPTAPRIETARGVGYVLRVTDPGRPRGPRGHGIRGTRATGPPDAP
jgi:two-component system OmpR family response regulator